MTPDECSGCEGVGPLHTCGTPTTLPAVAVVGGIAFTAADVASMRKGEDAKAALRATHYESIIRRAEQLFRGEP